MMANGDPVCFVWMSSRPALDAGALAAAGHHNYMQVHHRDFAMRLTALDPLRQQAFHN
jgi:hypothetical protein